MDDTPSRGPGHRDDGARIDVRQNGDIILSGVLSRA